jgi:catechol 2,3-dioxygenase-like lactoylglutathione lyase family enzyme
MMTVCSIGRFAEQQLRCACRATSLCIPCVVTSFDLVTINCPDPRTAASFWCAALGLLVVEDEDDGRWLVLAEVSGLRRIGLQRSAPAAAQQERMHLDLRCELHEFDSELRRLIALGSLLLTPDRLEPYGRIANLAALDGTPFDLCAYG